MSFQGATKHNQKTVENKTAIKKGLVKKFDSKNRFSNSRKLSRQQDMNSNESSIGYFHAQENPGFTYNFSLIPVNHSISPVIQPKLVISKPNDKYEQEADRVADLIMRMPDSSIKLKPT